MIMNLETFSRSTVVIVVMLAMAVSASPMAFAIETMTEPTPLSGQNSYNGPYFNEAEEDAVRLITARLGLDLLEVEMQGQAKDPARMVKPSRTPSPTPTPAPIRK